LRHHALPEGLQLGQGGFVNAFVALTRVRRRDDDGVRDFAKVIEKLFVLKGDQLAGGGQLRFAPRALMVLDIMFADVKGDLLKALFGGFGVLPCSSFARSGSEYGKKIESEVELRRRTAS
jgi:hypothetical protein